MESVAVMKGGGDGSWAEEEVRREGVESRSVVFTSEWKSDGRGREWTTAQPQPLSSALPHLRQRLRPLPLLGRREAFLHCHHWGGVAVFASTFHPSASAHPTTPSLSLLLSRRTHRLRM